MSEFFNKMMYGDGDKKGLFAERFAAHQGAGVQTAYPHAVG